MFLAPDIDLAAALEVAATRESTYRRLLCEALRGWTLSADDTRWTDALFGFDRPGHRVVAVQPLLSDCALRHHATCLLVDMMVAHWRVRPDGRRYFSATIFDDSGVTVDRRPQLNLPALIRKFRAALARTPLSLVMQLELQGVMNYPGPPQGRALLCHAHGLGWTDDPAWTAQPHKSAETFADAVNASPHWSSALGGDPLAINPIRQTAADIARVAAYLSKVPHDVKNRMPDHRRPGGHILMDTEAFRPDFALRIAEGLSQLAWRDAIFTVNDAPVGRRWRRRVLAWHRQRVAARRSVYDLGGQADVAARWAQLRARHGSPLFRPPFAWLKGADRPPPIVEATAVEQL